MRGAHMQYITATVNHTRSPLGSQACRNALLLNYMIASDRNGRRIFVILELMGNWVVLLPPKGYLASNLF